MTTADDQLRALLDDTAYRALESLARSSEPVSGRALARALNVSPTTATSALALLRKAGFVTSTAAGRSMLWYLDASNPTMRSWLQETAGAAVADHAQRPRLETVIFTALPLEYESVAAHLPDRRPTRVRATRFEQGEFTGDHVDWTVYVAEVGAGNIGTAIEVTAAIAALNPHLVLFVGVAASVKPKDLCQGDVVVANRVYNIHSGKDVHDEAHGSVHQTRPLSFLARHDTVQLAMEVRRRGWASELPAQASNARGRAPEAKISPIAASEVVHADSRSQLMQKVRTQFNDVAAVDMESLGLYEAAHRDDRAALAVRGISDCIDDKDPDSDAEWQPRAASHAAAFAFALLRRAEPEDFPVQGTRTVPDGGDTTSSGRSPAQQLLRVAPSVALAYEWAVPITGASAHEVLRDLAALGSQPATWLGRFRHRPPEAFRSEDSAALWVLVAEFADSHEHPAAPWFFEQAAQRWQGDPLSGYMYCRAAAAAARMGQGPAAEELIRRAEAAVPAGRPLWAFYHAALGPDIAVVAARILAVADKLELPFPQSVSHALQGVSTAARPDDDFAAFVEELAELHPAFLEQMRLIIVLAAAVVLRSTAGQTEAAQMLLEQIVDGLPAYRPGPASTSALAALAGSRSTVILLELAKTLSMRAADPVGRGSSFDADAVLTRAEEFALTARDRRLDWGGPTGEALALAAGCRAALGDVRGALLLLLPPPAGTANAVEAASQPVVQAAAPLAAQLGDIELALDLAAKVDDPVQRRLATALALSLREDSYPEAAAEYRAALADGAITARADLQMKALVGLSMVADLADDELALLEERDAEIADLIRARSFLKAGEISRAQVLARCYPDSEAALHIRVECLRTSGRTAEAIAALESFATRHHHDERLLLNAAVLALSTGAADEAVRLARIVASSLDPVRRRTAREIMLDVASSGGDWDGVLEQTYRLIGDVAIDESDPNRANSVAKYRWARAYALHQLRRMDDAYEVIRAEPRLMPVDLNQARLLASVLRTIAPSVTNVDNRTESGESGVTQREVLTAVGDAARAFPDDEELVATAVMTAFSMPTDGQLDYGQMAKARELHQQFFESFPNSRLMQAVPYDENLSGVKEFLRTHLAPVASAAEAMRRRAYIGGMPISVFAAAFGKNYAEALIRNAVGCYVVRYPDDHLDAQEIEAARRAVDKAVVVDTSALFLSPLTLEPATRLSAHFERLLVAAPQRDDIVQARASMAMRSAGSLGWDPESGRPTFEQYDEKLTARWAEQADNLAKALDRCDIENDPLADHGDSDPRHRVWSSPIRLARERGLSLVADDAALRAAARSEGIPAFGSLQLLTALVEDGALPVGTVQQAHRRLMGVWAAELPVLSRLREIAGEEQWNPAGYAAFLLARPATWLPIADGWRTYTTLIKALPEHGRQEVAGWCTAAITGLSLVTAPPIVPAAASGLIVWTLLELRDAAALPLLLEGAERVVKQFVPDVDLLEKVVQRLVTTMRQITPPDMVGAVVLPLLSGLGNDARAKAVECFFTMP
ncbi:nucleoside phosphorylase/tetratricopeptide (TPR) repeat protein/DNA-binding transcriptional ArsR family regulator [Catenulispora sp. GAS73]|uniref:phosphorylase family protein n=1 Tax=Catenulispora sp. GAS73 TaxID=3156269 RepID=UPI0035147CBC